MWRQTIQMKCDRGHEQVVEGLWLGGLEGAVHGPLGSGVLAGDEV